MMEYVAKTPTIPIPFHRLLKVVAIVDGSNRETRELLDQLVLEGRLSALQGDRFRLPERRATAAPAPNELQTLAPAPPFPLKLEELPAPRGADLGALGDVVAH